MNRLFFLFLFLVQSVFLFGKEAEAIYLTWQNDPTTTMTIQWITTNDDLNDTIEFEAVNEAGWKSSLQGKHVALPQEEPYFVHVVELTNLKPKTAYRFRIPGIEGTSLFRTMPETLSEPIVFAVGGDTDQMGHELFELTNKEAIKHEPLFTLFGGDLAYAAPNDTAEKEDAKRWLGWLNSYTKTMITKSGFRVPLLVALGNHDVKGFYGKTPQDAPFFFTLFATPGLPGYTSLQFGNYLTLLLLDSNHANPIKGKQADWIEAVLSKSQDSIHRMAIYHVPAYPSVRSFRLKESSSIRRYWVPLFERYNLSCAFENNDHAYKRTFPLIDDAPHPEGVIYLGDGGWGVKPRSVKSPDSTAYLAKTKSAVHFIKVKLSEGEREYTAIQPNGEVIDHYVHFFR